MKLLLGLLLWLAPGSVSAEAFQPGEKLVYRVWWFFIDAGEATLEVVSPSHFIARAESGLVFFYTVNDRVESFASEND